MKSATVDVLLVKFCYGGNGGVSSTIPELAEWEVRTTIKMKSDPRIGRIRPLILSDTPITMTRNRAVRIAKEEGYDMILMLDSDNCPDGYLGNDPEAKPFWDVAFTFAYERLIKGEPTCIFAPYCGPPPHPVDRGGFDSGEIPYLFQWMDNESDADRPQRKLEILNRNEAARLKGIWPMAAGPTGVCLFTTSCFEGMKPPYFFYEWNEDHSEKMSTEDVVATRNISLFWMMTRGIEVCFAACDSWALHHKPKKVGKPRVTPVEVMAKSFRDSLAENVSAKEKKVMVDYTANLPVDYESEGELLVTDAMRPVLNTKRDLDGVGNAVAVALEKQNGQALKHRMIGGRKVAAIQTEISDASIENITAMTNWLVDKNDGPLEVAVAHAGSGQSAAAILSSLPEGSHLYALDSTLTYQFSTEPSEQFAKSFQPELESGRVMADLSGRKFPYPEDQHHLDLVFIERSLTEDKLDTWYEHLTEGGLLGGLGYENPKFSRMVDEFVENNGLKVTASGDVWAIPK